MEELTIIIHDLQKRIQNGKEKSARLRSQIEGMNRTLQEWEKTNEVNQIALDALLRKQASTAPAPTSSWQPPKA